MLNQLVSSDPRVHIGLGTYATTPPLLRPHHGNNEIRIGKYCSFGQDVTVFAGGDHPLHAITMHPIGLWLKGTGINEWSADCGDDAEVTTVGNDVWLGHQCMVLSGSIIGNGAAIGARAVVKGEIPPYAVVAGNPARVLRFRFAVPDIQVLQSLRWWDWPEDHVRQVARHLRGSDVTNLARYAAQHGLGI